MFISNVITCPNQNDEPEIAILISFSTHTECSIINITYLQLIGCGFNAKFHLLDAQNIMPGYDAMIVLAK